MSAEIRMRFSHFHHFIRDFTDANEVKLLNSFDFAQEHSMT